MDDLTAKERFMDACFLLDEVEAERLWNDIYDSVIKTESAILDQGLYNLIAGMEDRIRKANTIMVGVDYLRRIQRLSDDNCCGNLKNDEVKELERKIDLSVQGFLKLYGNPDAKQENLLPDLQKPSMPNLS